MFFALSALAASVVLMGKVRSDIVLECIRCSNLGLDATGKVCDKQIFMGRAAVSGITLCGVVRLSCHGRCSADIAGASVGKEVIIMITPRELFAIFDLLIAVIEFLITLALCKRTAVRNVFADGG